MNSNHDCSGNTPAAKEQRLAWYKRPLFQSEAWFHPILRTMDVTIRREIINKAMLEAAASPRIVWLLLGFAMLYITFAILIPIMLGNGPSIAILFFVPLLPFLPHQINIHIAIREQIADWQQLQVAARGEA